MRRLALLFTVFLSTTGFSYTAASHTEAPKKVYVCKYVGTPGVDERLQTGQNPIDVSTNTIGEDPVVVGSYFNDAHGRSFVLAFDTGQDEPDVSQCPGYVPPTTTTTQKVTTTTHATTTTCPPKSTTTTVPVTTTTLGTTSTTVGTTTSTSAPVSTTSTTNGEGSTTSSTTEQGTTTTTAPSTTTTSVVSTSSSLVTSTTTGVTLIPPTTLVNPNPQDPTNTAVLAKTGSSSTIPLVYMGLSLVLFGLAILYINFLYRRY